MGQEAHVRDSTKKAAAAMKKVWGIGKRKFAANWGKIICMFDRLVWTVMAYGVEI